MRTPLFILLIIILTSCTEKYKAKGIFLPFNCNAEFQYKPPFSKTSSVFFFPKQLFYDTIRYIKYKDSIYDYSNKNQLDDLIKCNKFQIQYVNKLDSINVDKNNEQNLFIPKIISFSLLKLKEPILSQCYLSREVYRLIIAESFYPLSIISLNKSTDSIWVDFKTINKNVMFPFIQACPTKDVLKFREEFKGRKLNEKEIKRIEIENDSIVKIDNDTNYFISTYYHKRISKTNWVNFTKLLEKTNFWQSPSWNCNECISIDGGTWIMEGHCKLGYRFKDSPGDTFMKYFITLGIVDKKLLNFIKKYKILQLTSLQQQQN